jgi:hypothetical protein
LTRAAQAGSRSGRPAAAIKHAKPVSLLALAGSGRKLWGKDSSKALAGLRDEWTR